MAICSSRRVRPRAWGASFVAGYFNFTYYVGTGTSGTSLGVDSPTAAGTYTVVAAFTSVNPNYKNGTAQDTFAISPAAQTVSVTDGGIYNGKRFPAKGTATGVGGVTVAGSFSFTYYVGTGTSGTKLGATAPTAAGTYTVVAAFTSSNTDYGNGSAQVTFIISPAAPKIG